MYEWVYVRHLCAHAVDARRRCQIPWRQRITLGNLFSIPTARSGNWTPALKLARQTHSQAEPFLGPCSFFFKFFIYLCVCDYGSVRVGIPVPQHSCGAQRTTWGCWVSLSTTWAWRLNSGQQAWPQAPLSPESSCQPPSLHFKHKWTGIDSFLGLAKPH